MTLYFANSTPIDLAAIELMGVSVKPGDSPIGYFGTGLKFAIACALRNGATVRVRIAGVDWAFGLSLETIRDTHFDRVVMRNTETGEVRPLGFTTETGKNWKVWQAFREFESNCRDESGASARDQLPECPEGAWGTIFSISSPAFDDVWDQRDSIFLPSAPLWVSSGEIEIHPLGADPSAIFHRGVLAGRLDKPGLFTYNDLGGTLTEDRTIANQYMMASVALRAITLLAPQSVIETVITASDTNWESGWYSWPTWDISQFPKFEAAVEAKIHHPRLNGHAKHAWANSETNLEKQFERVEMTTEMLREAIPALALTRRLGADVGLEDFTVVESLGQNVFGLMRKGRIYIARKTFDMGQRFLASTLYEEWLHKTQGLDDCSRELQNLLFERLATITERVLELEAALPVEEVIIIKAPLPVGVEDTPEVRARMQEILENLPAELPTVPVERTEALRDDNIPF